MIWSCFLHIYQPPNQDRNVLERVVNESYRPIFRGLKKISQAKIILNINAVLTEQLYERGFKDVVKDILDLVKEGRVELTESAKFHAFIPLIPLTEALRQVKLNYETNKKYFGKYYEPKGFFSPEMSYSPKVAELCEKLGYKWIVADEIAYSGTLDVIKFNKLYKIKGFNVLTFFREKRTSNLIMGAIVRDAKKITDSILKRDSGSYLLTAMDGETFGHHRVGLDKVLLDILANPKIKTVTISELSRMYKEVEEVEPKDSTWASSEKDIADGNPFNLWFDKDNKIHEMEWELTSIAINAVNNSRWRDAKSVQWMKARKLLDSALHSCHFWWASANPWWSIEMVEEGIFSLLRSVLNVPDAGSEDKERTGFVKEKSEKSYSWKKIPFKKRAKPGEYAALIDLLRQEEEKSSKNREYEQAIRWRDAQIKLAKENDVYDAVHVIDQLMRFIDFKRYKDLVEKYRKEYKYINSGQPEK